MNFFSTGIKEVNRRLRRQKNRLALAAARKSLDEAEAALGRFGWRTLLAGAVPVPLRPGLGAAPGTSAGKSSRVSRMGARLGFGRKRAAAAAAAATTAPVTAASPGEPVAPAPGASSTAAAVVVAPPAGTAAGGATSTATPLDEELREALDTLRALDAELAANAAHITELEKSIVEHEAGRGQAKIACEAEVAKIDDERKPLLETERSLAARLQELQGKVLRHEHQAAELEDERQRLLRENVQLQHQGTGGAASATPTDETRAREMRKREVAGRRAALPEQLGAVHHARDAAAGPIAALEAELQKTRAELINTNRRMQVLRAGLVTREQEITAAVAAIHREIAARRRQAADIEAKKEKPYRVAGRALADRPVPPRERAGEELYERAHIRRQALESLVELDTGWAKESETTDRQDLRIFGFVITTSAVLLMVSLLLVFRSPGKRDYLPADTGTIVSINVGRFAGADLTRWLQQQEPDVWRELWTGLARKVSEIPLLDTNKNVTRITRALATPPAGSDDDGTAQDYLLVELRPGLDMDKFVPELGRVGNYRQFTVNGLSLYARTVNREEINHPEPGDPSFAQIGPRTLALGTASAVAELIRVRLGLSADLKVDTEFLNEFARLDRDSALRLVTLHPTRLRTLTDPLLSNELAAKCEMLGIAVDLEPGKPAAALFLIRAKDAAAAENIAGLLRATPEQVLQLQSAGPNLFIEPPVLAQREREVEWRFKMTSPATREFLERMSNLVQGSDRSVARK